MFFFPPMSFNLEFNTRLISVSQLLLIALFYPCYSQDTKPQRLTFPCNLRDMALFISCMLALALFQFFYVLCFYALFSHAANSTIQQGQLIRDGETLVSDDLNFEMGFFNLTNSSSRYVGIWYHNVTIPGYIWVANREKPVQGRGGAITINNKGKLVVLDGENKEVWSSNVSTTSFNESEAVLNGDGNLVLSTENGSRVLWQSFEDPTDTFVPGMKVPVGDGKRSNPGFTSWKSATDPSKGNYSMEVESGESPQIVILDGERRKRWRSGYWDGRIFTGVSTTGSILYGFKLNDEGEGGARYFVYNKVNPGDKVRFQIDSDGYERKLQWNEDGKNWDVTQSEPYNQCDFYNYCGSFAVCDDLAKPMCVCLEGFEPRDRDQWGRGNWSEGCKRRTPLKAESTKNGSGTEGTVGEDGFFGEKDVKLPDSAQIVNPGGTTSDCERTCLMNNSCTAYANVVGIGCMIWHGELDDIQRLENLADVLNIRLADADLGNGENKTKIWITSIVVVGLICLGIFAWLVWRYKGKLKAKKNNDLPLTEATNSRDLSLELSESADLTLEGNQLNGPELPFFKFSSIAIATNNFSKENKLGQGGFGPVYKGTLAGGEEIAVKRLSTLSCQGLVEFKNEMMLIAKLQHRNLVRLMGYSIEGEEKLLLYEYLPNKSLDCFLFDAVKQTQLDWTRRFEIIEGIARGLLYLHRDSRLRIIHRDLKASNILLDENMNPKISDFGLARIFGGNENEANTTKVVGTYGYIAPEYAMEGLFSVKSDVYSFGVLLLEIVCGRRNSSFRHAHDTSLVGYASHLWSENRVIELVDPSIRDSSPKNKVLRCIHIGMLCIQDSTTHRPDMSSVVLMLESEATSLPLPRLPLFSSMRRHTDREFNIESLDVSNNVTVTMVTGR